MASRTSTCRWSTTKSPDGEGTSRTEISPAELHQLRVLGVGEFDQPVTGLQQPQSGALRVDDIQDLDLRLHHGGRAGRGEASAHPGDPGRVAGRRHHGGLLGGHGNEHVGAVHDEVRRHSHRDTEHPDHVLDHVVGLLDGQAGHGVEGVQYVGRQPGGLRREGAPLVGRGVPEPADPALNSHDDLPQRSARLGRMRTANR
jgi:hypothetical protein